MWQEYVQTKNNFGQIDAAATFCRTLHYFLDCDIYVTTGQDCRTRAQAILLPQFVDIVFTYSKRI